MMLIDKAQPGDLLPSLIEGIGYDDLHALNNAFKQYDDALLTQIAERLQAAGIPKGWLKVYPPGAGNDDRPICVEDPNPPSKRPDPLPFAQSAVVRIDT